MKETSPTRTTSTNKGGRPKEWTPERQRKLIRLYLYTKLPPQRISDLLKDPTWLPKKDAASKWLNALLGHDPRWIKPKTTDEEEKRMAGLKASCHRSKRENRQHTVAENPSRGYGTASQPTSTIPHGLENLDGLTLDHSHSSLPTESDGSTLANLPWFSNEPSLHPAYVARSDPLAESSRRPRSSWHTMSHMFPRALGGQGPKRRDSGLTNSTDLSATSSFRNKLSDATPKQVKAAYELIKRYTIPKDYETDVSPASPSLPTGLFSQSRTGPVASPRLIVPGDFLSADFMLQAQGLPNFPPNEATESWAKVAKEVLSAQNLWPSKGRCSINSDSPWELQALDPSATDDFGNTVFHFLAARGSQRALVDQIMQAEEQFPAAIGSRNTAGQTLLHMLNQSWFEDGSPLGELLSRLNHIQFDILAVDVYGRNFFHLLRERRLHPERIRDLAHPFSIKTLNRRDAFDRKPMDSRSARRMWRAAAIHRLYPGRTPRLHISTEDPASARIHSHTELLRVVTNAMNVDTRPNPDAEDSDGRNAFQCLAEVVLGNLPIQKHAISTKRKLGVDMEPKLQDGNLSYRLELLGQLISAGVDVNHYDKLGQTPLMAFVKHIPDGVKEDNDLREIITKLVQAGANMEARSRQGETALYMAARLGKKVALKKLVELGANICVRNPQGLHILDAAHQALQTAANDTYLYARLYACCAMLSGQLGERWKTVTVLDEWRVRHRLDYLG
ncbi:hypothetical protein SLS62_010617 [Diatrype stigma]|uniref:Uncharacterized protein n=1 Tax=Diatrype stigma TaxID=117547 RepID=A0AAN9UBM7_9PEZI